MPLRVESNLKFNLVHQILDLLQQLALVDDKLPIGLKRLNVLLQLLERLAQVVMEPGVALKLAHAVLLHDWAVAPFTSDLFGFKVDFVILKLHFGFEAQGFQLLDYDLLLVAQVLEFIEGVLQSLKRFQLVQHIMQVFLHQKLLRRNQAQLRSRHDAF